MFVEFLLRGDSEPFFLEDSRVVVCVRNPDGGVGIRLHGGGGFRDCGGDSEARTPPSLRGSWDPYGGEPGGQAG